MRKLKLSLLAFGVTAALAGCNSSSDQTDPEFPAKDYPVAAPEHCNHLIAPIKISGEQDWDNTYSVVLQAEDAILEEVQAQSPGNPADEWVEGHEGSGWVRMDGSGFIHFQDIKVNESGLNQFLVRGGSPWGVKQQLVQVLAVDGTIVSEQPLQMWTTPDRPKTFVEYPIAFDLESGTYDFVVHADYGYAFFDSLKVADQTTILNSTVSAENLVFAKEQVRDVTSSIQFNHNKLVGFEIAGKPVPVSLDDSCEVFSIGYQELAELEEGEHELLAVFDKGANFATNLVVVNSIVQPGDGKYHAAVQNVGNGAYIKEDDSSETGRYVRFDASGELTFPVKVDREGHYDIEIRYRAERSAERQEFLVNGEYVRPGGAGFEITLDNEWEMATFPVILQEGNNTITLQYASGNMDIDYLWVDPHLSTTPAVIQPQQQAHYKGDHAKPVRFKVEPTNNKLEYIFDKGVVESLDRVTLDGMSVDYEVVPALVQVESGRWMNVLNDAYWIEFPVATLDRLEGGTHELEFRFTNGKVATADLTIYERDEEHVAAFTMISFNVDHGVATLMMTPTGKNVIVDTAKPHVARERILPFMRANNLALDEIWISHNHDDHYGGLEALLEEYPGAVVRSNAWLNVPGFGDHKDQQCVPGESRFRFREDLDDSIYGLSFDILNQHGDRCQDNYLDFNPNSLAFIATYYGRDEEGVLNGKTFKLNSQGDIYGQQQDEILYERGTSGAESTVFLSNHHFHGSISEDYVTTTNAELVIVSASHEVYRAGAFTGPGMKAINQLRESKGDDFRNMLLTFDVGHTIIKVNPDASYTYETVFKDRLEEGELLNQLKVESLRGYPTR